MNMKTKEFKYAFAVAAFCSICFNLCLMPLSYSFFDSFIIFCGTIFFIMIPFFVPKKFLEVDD